MSINDEFQQRARSIETLVGKLENASDPALKNAAKDLVQAIMELHAAGLARMLELVHDVGDTFVNGLIDRFGRDQLVRSLLLLHGLHPQDLHTRVTQALEDLRPTLNSHQANAELISIDESGSIIVHFHVNSAGCGSTVASVKARIEAALLDAAPDAASIVVNDVSIPSHSAVFVPLAHLTNAKPLDVARAERSGD
jgi:Fe-S cluster biogenesis protein NfuA